MSIILSNQLSTAAAQTALDLQGLIGTMKTSGMTNQAIKASLMSDLNSGGVIFGKFRNQVKSTVKDGIGRAGNEGSRTTFTEAGVQEFRWISVGDDRVCPDCEPRHGDTGTLDYFETIGLPQSGFSVCQLHCRCQLIPVKYKGENLDKPLVRKKIHIKENIDNYFTNNKVKGLKGEYQSAIASSVLKLKKKNYINAKIDTIQFSEKVGKEWGSMSRSGTLSFRKSFFDKHLESDQLSKFIKKNSKEIKSQEDLINTLTTRKGIIGREKGIKQAQDKIAILKSTKRWNTADDVLGLARIENVATHELGHYVDFTNDITEGWDTNKGSLFGKYLKNNNVKEIDIKTISHYAHKNQKELFAETFALYNTGRKRQIPKNILKAFESALSDKFI